MRPLSGRSRGSSLVLLPIVLLTYTVSAAPAPAPQPQPSPELGDRSLADVIANVGDAAENITQSVGAIIQDVTSIVQTFVSAVAEIKNASTENDLVGLLGMDVQGAVDDSNDTANGTVSAVGSNITCPGMAVLFARGTTEPGMSSLPRSPRCIYIYIYMVLPGGRVAGDEVNSSGLPQEMSESSRALHSLQRSATISMAPHHWQSRVWTIQPRSQDSWWVARRVAPSSWLPSPTKRPPPVPAPKSFSRGTLKAHNSSTTPWS